MRVRDGKIAEHWGVANLFSLMQQLGAVRPPQRRLAPNPVSSFNYNPERNIT